MNNLPAILVVDDDNVTGNLLCEVLEKDGFVTQYVQSSSAALGAVDEFKPDVIISDIRMNSSTDGLDLLTELRQSVPQTPVILMTAFGSMETAVQAVRQGAFDYLSKPFLNDQLVSTVRRALSTTPGDDIPKAVKAPEHQKLQPTLIGRHSEMLQIYKTIGLAADATAPILITGESGTGKELIARATHFQSKRHLAPFVAVNCGALTETLLESELFGHIKGSFTGAIANKRGIFEQAKDGTVFLDEISETSINLQVKLLRVLQEKEIVPVGGESPIEVRARVVAATNADLEQLCLAGLFRRDLFYRLNVINIHLPPLRERSEDIPLLIEYLVRRHVGVGKTVPVVDHDALQCLTSYSWPGNVRELENVIERAIAFDRDERISLEDLPVTRLRDGATESVAGAASCRDSNSRIPTMYEVERAHLIHVLDLTGGNRKKTAELLGINRRTLYRMAERFGVTME